MSLGYFMICGLLATSAKAFLFVVSCSKIRSPNWFSPKSSQIVSTSTTFPVLKSFASQCMARSVKPGKRKACANRRTSLLISCVLGL
eukprot:Skav228266  [mRNA]  locus=scaffold778:34224:37522:- [translate_table: standard]